MRSYSLAVPTPRSVDFQKHFFLAFQDSRFKSSSDNSFDSCCLLSWSWSWFQKRFPLSWLNLSSESCKCFRCQIRSITNVFFLSFNKIEERWGRFDRNSEKFSESGKMILILFFVDCGIDMFWVTFG